MHLEHLLAVIIPIVLAVGGFFVYRGIKRHKARQKEEAQEMRPDIFSRRQTARGGPAMTRLEPDPAKVSVDSRGDRSPVVLIRETVGHASPEYQALRPISPLDQQQTATQREIRPDSPPYVRQHSVYVRHEGSVAPVPHPSPSTDVETDTQAPSPESPTESCNTPVSESIDTFESFQINIVPVDQFHIANGSPESRKPILARKPESHAESPPEKIPRLKVAFATDAQNFDNEGSCSEFTSIVYDVGNPGENQENNAFQSPVLQVKHVTQAENPTPQPDMIVFGSQGETDIVYLAPQPFSDDIRAAGQLCSVGEHQSDFQHTLVKVKQRPTVAGAVLPASARDSLSKTTMAQKPGLGYGPPTQSTPPEMEFAGQQPLPGPTVHNISHKQSLREAMPYMPSAGPVPRVSEPTAIAGDKSPSREDVMPQLTVEPLEHQVAEPVVVATNKPFLPDPFLQRAVRKPSNSHVGESAVVQERKLPLQDMPGGLNHDAKDPSSKTPVGVRTKSWNNSGDLSVSSKSHSEPDTPSASIGSLEKKHRRRQGRSGQRSREQYRSQRIRLGEADHHESARTPSQSGPDAVKHVEKMLRDAIKGLAKTRSSEGPTEAGFAGSLDGSVEQSLKSQSSGSDRNRRSSTASEVDPELSVRLEARKIRSDEFVSHGHPERRREEFQKWAPSSSRGSNAPTVEGSRKSSAISEMMDPELTKQLKQRKARASSPDRITAAIAAQRESRIAKQGHFDQEQLVKRLRESQRFDRTARGLFDRSGPGSTAGSITASRKDSGVSEIDPELSIRLDERKARVMSSSVDIGGINRTLTPEKINSELATRLEARKAISDAHGRTSKESSNDTSALSDSARSNRKVSPERARQKKEIGLHSKISDADAKTKPVFALMTKRYMESTRDPPVAKSTYITPLQSATASPPSTEMTTANSSPKPGGATPTHHVKVGTGLGKQRALSPAGRTNLKNVKKPVDSRTLPASESKSEFLKVGGVWQNVATK